MKKLIGHIALFCFPILLIVVLFPISRRQLYHELKDDCFNHGIWIHDRIYENEQPIDLAFIGSSHTINCIDDKLIDSLTGFHSANLGYCRLGINLNEVLIEDLLEKKKPKIVFIEVRENEDRYSHPVYPNLARSNQVLFPYLLFNRDILSDIKQHLFYKLQLTQDLTFGKYAPSKVLTTNFGVANSTDTASVSFLNEVKTKRHQEIQLQNGFAKWFYMKYPKHYLSNVEQLLSNKEVKVVFLYLPSFGSGQTQPSLINTYKKHGDVWIAPESILSNPNHWFDENHLNHQGAQKYSKWLAEKLQR